MGMAAAMVAGADPPRDVAKTLAGLANITSPAAPSVLRIAQKARFAFEIITGPFGRRRAGTASGAGAVPTSEIDENRAWCDGARRWRRGVDHVRSMPRPRPNSGTLLD